MSRNSLRDRLEAMSKMLHEASFTINSDMADKISLELTGSLYNVRVREKDGEVSVKWCEGDTRRSFDDNWKLKKYCKKKGYTYAGPDIGEDLPLDVFKEIVKRACGSQTVVDKLLRPVEYQKILLALRGVKDAPGRAVYSLCRMHDDPEFVRFVAGEVNRYTYIDEEHLSDFDWKRVRDFSDKDWQEVLETDENVKGIRHGFYSELASLVPFAFSLVRKGWISSDFTTWPCSYMARWHGNRTRKLWHDLVNWYKEYDCPWQMTIRQYLLACEDPSKVRAPDGREWSEGMLRDIQNILTDTVEGLAAQFKIKAEGKEGVRWYEGYKGFYIHLSGYYTPTRFAEEEQGLYCAVGGGYVRFDSSPGMMRIREEILQAARMVLPGNRV